MKYQVRELKEAQLESTIDLCVQCFGEEWRKIANVDFPASFSEHPYKSSVLIAVDGDKVIGVSMVAPLSLTPDAHGVTWLCVDEAYRRQGIAEKLLKKTEGFILENLLMFDSAMVVLASAVDSKYYESFGYTAKSSAL